LAHSTHQVGIQTHQYIQINKYNANETNKLIKYLHYYIRLQNAN